MSDLKELCQQMKEDKPPRWSVVMGDRQIVVRPPNRQIGKFTVTRSVGEEVCIAFFSEASKVWVDYRYFLKTTPGKEIMSWMLSQVEIVSIANHK